VRATGKGWKVPKGKVTWPTFRLANNEAYRSFQHSDGTKGARKREFASQEAAAAFPPQGLSGTGIDDKTSILMVSSSYQLTCQ
jgi:hypothetical protein